MSNEKAVRADQYKGIDFRAHPEQYVVGRGDQGALVAEPYRSELLPYWTFATPEKAAISARKLYAMFISYKRRNDFVGMDMARKFLQMGFTRAGKSAKYPLSGKRYSLDGFAISEDQKAVAAQRAEAARIFYEYYVMARDDELYKHARQMHRAAHG